MSDMEGHTDEECGVCYEKFEIAATTNCMHTVCYSCFLRNRVLCRRTACLLCSDPIKNAVIYNKDSVTPTRIKKLLSREHVHTNFDFRYIARYHAVIANDVIKDVNLLDLPPCPICDCHVDNRKALQAHIKAEHKVEYCFVCLNNKPSFMSDQLTYAHEDLKRHLDTHPRCPLCLKLQYDADSYKDHLLTNHHRCEICREHGISDSYWETAADLIEHQRADHFVCLEQECKDLMIAFGTQDELLKHRLEKHPNTFTQTEMESTQMYLFCGGTGDKKKGRFASGLASGQGSHKPKKKDVTHLISLSKFSLSSRIQTGEVRSSRQRRYQAPPFNSDAIFEMNMQTAMRNSLQTAKMERLMREAADDDNNVNNDNDGITAYTNAASNRAYREPYDPAIELLARHKSLENAGSEQRGASSDILSTVHAPVVVASAALPDAGYGATNMAENMVEGQTAVQATYNLLYGQIKSAKQNYSHLTTKFDTGTPTPLTRKEIEQEYAKSLGIVYKRPKKKTESAPQQEETVSADNIEPSNSTSNKVTIRVNDLGQFGASSSHSSELRSAQVSLPPSTTENVEQPPANKQKTRAVREPIDIDTSSAYKTAVQATLELASKRSYTDKSQIDQICGIPIFYKSKKRKTNE